MRIYFTGELLVKYMGYRGGMTHDGDLVDDILQQWDNAYPAIGTAPVEVIGRITRIGALALRDLDRALVPTGVGRGEFDVLGALARSDRPLRSSEVTSLTMVSNAATTKYVDALVRKRLVERGAWERDKRVVLLAITDAGRAVVDAEFPARVERDRHLLDGLSDDERVELVGLLRRVTANAEAADRRRGN